MNVGKILLECSGMLAAFQAYCVKQAGAALLLAGLEKEKELLRIFLRVSQMENTVLRRMNLNSFLMVCIISISVKLNKKIYSQKKCFKVITQKFILKELLFAEIKYHHIIYR